MIAAAFAVVEVKVSECCLDTDADISCETAYATLNNEERARAARFVFARDAKRFVRGRGYLRKRLGAFLHLPPAQAPIGVGEHGKPFVEGRRAQFNLSHSGSRAVLAITSEAEVGIDIETLDRPDSLAIELDGLSRMCLNDDERRALMSLPAGQRALRFLSYWTAKEARMKLTGEGFALDPLDISLELSNGEPVGYRRPDAPRAELRFIRLSRPNTVCCLAIKTGDGSGPDIRDGRC